MPRSPALVLGALVSAATFLTWLVVLAWDGGDWSPGQFWAAAIATLGAMALAQLCAPRSITVMLSTWAAVVVTSTVLVSFSVSSGEDGGLWPLVAFFQLCYATVVAGLVCIVVVAVPRRGLERFRTPLDADGVRIPTRRDWMFDVGDQGPFGR